MTWPSVQDVAHVRVDVMPPHADAHEHIASEGPRRSAPHRWNRDALHCWPGQGTRCLGHLRALSRRTPSSCIMKYKGAAGLHGSLSFLKGEKSTDIFSA